jgi:hypothetical protein
MLLFAYSLCDMLCYGVVQLAATVMFGWRCVRVGWGGCLAQGDTAVAE